MAMNKLTTEDHALFEYMRGHYVSENEKTFFEQLRYKQENVFTTAHELIMSESNNADGIYIVRCEFEEYIIGQERVIEEQHVMSLSEALNINLKTARLLDRDMTLFEWLRTRDYSGVEYNHNYDEI